VKIRPAAWICVIMVVISFCADVVRAGSGAEIEVSCKSAIMVEAHSGRTLYEHNADERLPMASVTKIMTLILGLEDLHAGYVRLDDTVVGSEYAKSMGGTQIWLEVGERMSYKDILYAIAVGSANDAAVALAEHLAGSESAFARRMNEKARDLGMENTWFSNASGLPPSDIGGKDAEHYSTARDLARMSVYAIKVPMLLDLVSTYRYVIRDELVLWNFNRLLDRVMPDTGNRFGYPGMDGLKTGMTQEAGYCLAATAMRDNLRLVVVVLGARSTEARNADVTKLLNHGFSTYEAVPVLREGEEAAQIKLSGSLRELVPVVAKEDFYVARPKREKEELQTEVQVQEGLKAPIAAGTVVARLVVKAGDEEIDSTELIVPEEVKRATILQMVWRTATKLMRNLVPRF